ncbi:MAG: methyltransferase domain-containing protein [Chloroflexi bacterium]|nr:methyltransferase domain-containing protein [Chloroflexota bacterium]
MSNEIASHYSPGNLGAAIEAGLKVVTGNTRPATIDDLAPVDEFHIGSRAASVHLFDQLGLTSADIVLDVGAGIGGSSRFVAKNYGCKVTGIDLTPEFSEVGNSLNEKFGLSDLVSIQQGSALEMPFEDDSFSVVYMMHVGMNISDKAALYSEIRRVLKPGGKFAVYDVLKGSNPAALEFPVPWATEPSSSFLATVDQMRELLTNAGFEIDVVEDRIEFAVEFFKGLTPPAGGPPPIGLHLIIGKDTPIKIKNMVDNINNDLCGPWELIAH